MSHSPTYGILLRMTKLLAIATLAFTLGAVCPTSIKCPLHEYSNGERVRTDYIDGKLVATFKCPHGHTFQVVCD